MRAQLAALLVVASTAGPALAEQPHSAISHQSGYGDQRPGLGGPSAVESELETLDEKRDSLYQLDVMTRTFDPWFDWKRAVKEDTGLKLALNALFLYQHSNEESPASEREHSGGGIYRFQGSWAAMKTGNTQGRLDWRLEARNAIGGAPSPQQHGGEFMASLTPGFPYGDDFDADLSVLSWTQSFENKRIGFAIGRLAFDAYLDAFVAQTPYGGFLNRSFVYNPTLATTGAGALGAVAKGMVSDSIWLGGQIYDGNAANGEWDFDTFKEHEWLKSVEIGWTPSFDRRATDRIQLSYWQKDARHAAGISEGSGWALSASWQWNEPFLTFVRVGHSDGGAGVAAESAISTGFNYQVRPEASWSIGLGWAEPSSKTHGANLDNEWVVETSYKLQMTPNFSLTPDLQLLFNPARAAEHDRLWIAGLRAVFTL